MGANDMLHASEHASYSGNVVAFLLGLINIVQCCVPESNNFFDGCRPCYLALNRVYVDPTGGRSIRGQIIAYAGAPVATKLRDEEGSEAQKYEQANRAYIANLPSGQVFIGEKARLE